MDTFIKLGGVFGVAFISFWASIPSGIALGLFAPLVGLTAVLSYSAGALLIIVVGEPLRLRLGKRFGGKSAANPNSLIRRAWDRFGLVGLALLAPLTTGAQIGAIIGLTLGVPGRRLWLALTLGAVVWGVILTTAIMLGVNVVRG